MNRETETETEVETEMKRPNWRQRDRGLSPLYLLPHPASSLSSLNGCTVMEKWGKQNTGIEEWKKGKCL